MTTPRVAIVGYRMGNIASLRNAFVALGVDVHVAETPAELRAATHLVLPGVGAFPTGMEHLRALGFEAELRTLVEQEGRPLLGICLGMHLLASVGEEHRVCDGLGFLPGRVTRLGGRAVRVPHIGWNDTRWTRPNALLAPPETGTCFYYVHSYHLVPDDANDGVMACDHGEPVVAGVQRGHVFGVQFHPEKSHGGGLKILKRFTEVGSAEAPVDRVPLLAERAHRP